MRQPPKNPKNIREYWRDAQRRHREKKKLESAKADQTKADPNPEHIPEEMLHAKNG